MATPRSKIANSGSAVIEASSNHGLNSERERIFNAFRQWGYLEGDLDPLGFLRPRIAPELQIESEYTREARAIYSSTIGVEINHIYAPERRRWIYERERIFNAFRQWGYLEGDLDPLGFLRPRIAPELQIESEY